MSVIGLNPEADTYVNSEKPTTALGNVALGIASAFRLIVGQDAFLMDGTANAGTCFTWMRFDLSGIPTNAIITNAYLNGLCFLPVSNYVGLTVVAQRATNITWGESTITFVNAPNASVLGPYVGSVTFDSSGPNQVFNMYGLASAVQDSLIDRKMSLRLIRVNDDEEIIGAYLQDYDYNSPAPETRYPYLVVEWTVPAASPNEWLTRTRRRRRGRG